MSRSDKTSYEDKLTLHLFSNKLKRNFSLNNISFDAGSGKVIVQKALVYG